MQDHIPDALIAAFERQYDASWNDPQLRNERLAMRYGWAAAMEVKQCLHQIQERAGLSVSNAETIEAVIDERDAFMRWYSDALKAKGPWDKSIHFAFDAWQARAALAADPAAAQGGEHG